MFIVNDRLDVAIACGADGVHLGQDDIRVGVARQIAPSGFIIGVSVGTVDEAVRAEEEGADYIAISAVFSTASKNDAVPVAVLLLYRKSGGVFLFLSLPSGELTWTMCVRLSQQEQMVWR